MTTAEGDGAAVRTFSSQVDDTAASAPTTRPATSAAGSPATTRPPAGRGDDPAWWVLGPGAGALVVLVGALVVRARRRGE